MAQDILDELDTIWAAVPFPGENWHPWVAELRRLDADVRAAIEVLDETAGSREELEALLEEAVAAEDAGADSLGEAVRRLALLARPAGQHPFLHEIVPGLEAAGVLFAAVGRSPEARQRFGRRARLTVWAGS